MQAKEASAMSRARAATSRSSPGNFTGFDEGLRGRLAAEELEPRLRRSNRQEPLQDRGVVERFWLSGMAWRERDFLEQA